MKTNGQTRPPSNTHQTGTIPAPSQQAPNVKPASGRTIFAAPTWPSPISVRLVTLPWVAGLLDPSD